MTSVTLKVKVKPNARSSSLERGTDGVWVAKLKAPPVDGKANRELVELVANHFGCRRGDVVIKAGAASRLKVLQVVSR